MTFSVVARDPGSGCFGVAIATARPSVGARSAFARPGIGACATQAIVNPALAGGALAALAGGDGATSALASALATDPDAARRQVLLSGPDGTAAHTGAEVAGWAGHLTGLDVVVGGNLLAGAEPLHAMLAAFEETPGELADRLLAALVAGDAAGGDRRGRESAALLVVDTRAWPAVDLRVDHDPDPVTRLGALLPRWRAHWTAYDVTGAFVPADPPGQPGRRPAVTP
ncbi:DUF1028 domain-containing protein [Pimelobacter sp. 30-1]|uniref:DUF1028 domain-containing protein n=1 Tax=Pimelobacter sp. 30-1 TaxID=2004991 RepID=UPI001C03BE58|nr:DUF1028 domain-containing protein [Pimelobacter sp. 30-1]MBU2695677.1 hypothetical protein [Pimelobacter sp. 30-1]